jgi:radical SAM protein with 4Fe4S-binding SPASM domain
MRVLDKVAKAGCIWLTLTGGEPLCRHDWRKIYQHAVNLGMVVSLFSNGTLLNESDVDFLREWPPFIIAISLYAMTRETSLKVTGLPDAAERARQAVRRLAKAGVPVALRTLVTRANRHELTDIQDFAESEGYVLGIAPLLEPCLDGVSRIVPIRLPPEDVVQLSPKGVKSSKSLVLNSTEQKDQCHKMAFSCNTSGLVTFRVDPSGKLLFCNLLRQPAYDLLSRSFADGWDALLREVRSIVLPPSFECNKCTLQPNCAWCPAWSKLENGDMWQRAEYLCDVARFTHAANVTEKRNGISS